MNEEENKKKKSFFKNPFVIGGLIGTGITTVPFLIIMWVNKNSILKLRVENDLLVRENHRLGKVINEMTYQLGKLTVNKTK